MFVDPDNPQAVRPHWCFIAISEKDFCDLTKEEMEWVDDILRIYMYDKNKYTYCAEITPSYWMIPLDFRVNIKPEYTDAKYGDEYFTMRDNLEDEFLQYGYGEPSYYHVNEINSLENVYRNDPVKAIGYFCDNGESEQTVMSGSEYEENEEEMYQAFRSSGF